MDPVLAEMSFGDVVLLTGATLALVAGVGFLVWFARHLPALLTLPYRQKAAYPHFQQGVHDFLYFDAARIQKVHRQLPARSTDADVETTHLRDNDARLRATVGLVEGEGRTRSATQHVVRTRREHSMEEQHNEFLAEHRKHVVRDLDNFFDWALPIHRRQFEFLADRALRGSAFVMLDGPMTLESEDESRVVYLRKGSTGLVLAVECDRASFVEPPARILTGPVGCVGKVHGKREDGAVLVRALSIFR